MTILRPPVPNPLTASHDTVREFLVQFILSQICRCTRHEAERRATKIEVDGQGLYELSEEELTDGLGMPGKTIYHALQTSKYGYVS